MSKKINQTLETQSINFDADALNQKMRPKQNILADYDNEHMSAADDDIRRSLEVNLDKRNLLHRIDCNLNGILNELAYQNRLLRGDE